MDIQEWFDSSGSYADGLDLYKKLPIFSNAQFNSLKMENFSNFIRLKYELKRGLMLGYNVSTNPNEIPEIPEIPQNSEKSEPKETFNLQAVLQEAKEFNFAKETMAMYRMELHPVYRKRISDFYLACELKFKLNALKPNDEKNALDIILQLETVWDEIDRAWLVLEYWKDNARLMPTTPTKDFSCLNPPQLWKEKALIESRISKREKTLKKVEDSLEADPDNRVKANQYKKKKEALEQLKIDLQTIKNMFENEKRNTGSA